MFKKPALLLLYLCVSPVLPEEAGGARPVVGTAVDAVPAVILNIPSGNAVLEKNKASVLAFYDRSEERRVGKECA